MKTTIDIPEPLYKQVKIRAVERGQTLKQVVLDALHRELKIPASDRDHGKSSGNGKNCCLNSPDTRLLGHGRPASVR